MEEIMKPLGLAEETKEPVNESIKKEDVIAIPMKIEIPKDVINLECGPESEEEKIRTKDFLEWKLQYPKEYYRNYIADFEKILFSYHPESENNVKKYSIRTLGFIIISGIIAYLLNMLFELWGVSIFITCVIMACPAVRLFSQFQNYRGEIIFTDKKILYLTHTIIYFTAYSNIKQANKFHDKSAHELKRLEIKFKNSVINAINGTTSGIQIQRLPLNSPIYAILSKYGVPIYRGGH
jgi:hypothetical protein